MVFSGYFFQFLREIGNGPKMAVRNIGNYRPCLSLLYDFLPIQKTSTSKVSINAKIKFPDAQHLKKYIQKMFRTALPWPYETVLLLLVI